MKKLSLLLAALLITVISYAQDAPKADTTKIWTIHGENTFLISQSSYSNWSAGGVNAFAGNLIFNYDFNYKRDKWSWDNKVILGYGLSKQQDAGWRKNDDRIILNSLLGRQASQYWLYTFYMNFQTQFTKGYDYTTEPKTLISNIFAPAYLTFGPGFAYKRSDNFRVNISPAAARIIMVNDDYLSSIGAFGVTPGSKSLFQFGASLDAYYKVNLVQNISLENILKLYSDYLHKPGDIYTDYTANLFMKVNKFVTVNAGVQLIYDGKTRIPNEDGSTKIALQVKQILGAGITYKF
ncbi:DUF3078 domain-containing protein [Mucilaginibacter sabulilitoris]|uniref:DUF3078 domain-containing protein n=1 Tax=Mucilaginibacter sabulilitoris TaxID=1173583 RepID=A0ABZ0TKP2_9SPHI|nr:DUF3078 domain-containing protein [Mucilaginibacter sabulilitoris]WPU93628.1 DUF3078 domain-containing protein [Mucilaginibacter sabulilitoris]